MAPADPSDIDQAAQMISEYLDNHPDAADTLDGIVDWWLARQRRSQTRDTVQQALERLVQRGVVVPIDAGGGKLIYGSAARRTRKRLH